MDTIAPKKRGRPPGSKNKPKTANQILTATKGVMQKKKNVRKRRVKVAEPIAPKPKIEPYVIEESAEFWRNRYLALEKEVKYLMEFITSDVERDNVESDYKLKVGLRTKFKEAKFNRNSSRSGTYADPFTKIYHFLDNEDAYELKQQMI